MPLKTSWTITLDELEKFMGLIVARGVIGGRKVCWINLGDTLWSTLLCHIGDFGNREVFQV